MTSGQYRKTSQRRAKKVDPTSRKKPTTAGLVPHPVATLFPEMPPDEFAALKTNIRIHGLKLSILVHGGEILDGRHRYRACQELNIPCPTVEWTGHDPWLEVQSRNLIRRHLAKDQACAIRMLAVRQFPELAAPIEAIKATAKLRRAQAKGKPRGQKALSGSQDRFRESADVIGATIGVSGTTVKRVERLAREVPERLPKVAAGELSVKDALRQPAAPGGPQAGAKRARERSSPTMLPFHVD
jgi:hypothetical protein